MKQFVLNKGRFLQCKELSFEVCFSHRGLFLSPINWFRIGLRTPSSLGPRRGSGCLQSPPQGHRPGVGPESGKLLEVYPHNCWMPSRPVGQVHYDGSDDSYRTLKNELELMHSLHAPEIVSCYPLRLPPCLGYCLHAYMPVELQLSLCLLC